MKFRVSAMVTISVSTLVEAPNRKKAIQEAQNRGLQGLCHHCASPRTDHEEWVTSGELDGEPFDLAIEREDGDDH